MKLVWAHDHTFYFNESGKFFSGGKLPYAVWERYLGVFDQLTIACRGKKTPLDADMTGKTLSSGANVEFLVLPSLSNPVNKLTKRGYIEQLLTEAIGKADAVIARLPSEIGAEAIRVARSLGKPYAVEVVACAWDGLWNYGSVQGKLYAPLALQQTRALVKSAPYSLYVTEQFLQQRYPCVNGLTESCSNVEIPEPGEEVLNRRLERIMSGSSQTTMTIGLIGSLNGGAKGIDVALKAIAKAKPHLPRVWFRVLGDGDPSRWQALADKLGIGSAVTFEGVLPSGGAVFEWLDNIDLYLQPSFQEGLPRATIEAMSRGCPVLGSTAGGIPELIHESCLHRPGQAAQLAEQLKRAAVDRAWVKEQAELNFGKSRGYTKVRLDAKRQAFWRSFGEYVRSGGAVRTTYSKERVEAL
ncbi:glycosyltransferase family 4 protein [Paenibacillus sp. NEAU-GSW1]|uniref:glycosyltransferase family 4 protein n=1 Tax=Paenibacillus sp. NEAU-GSW1 TaxID=2682486 RepID=UPI0012E167A9|nr:glycosyltransferase family 4 protein [Paenibacillus sp. NEAU-GSW1]MUT64770.1 glycosyltransferase [Paenibacillus sp. NEAU-GSW1]